jgi:hypothetical protein
MEQQGLEFRGYDIVYDNACVSKNSTDNISFQADKITTDLAMVLENSDSNSSVVSDEGFVLIACDADNTVLTEAPIIGSEWRLNNTLSWSHLHPDYWKYKRSLLKGLMNNVFTNFITSIKAKAQMKILVPLCCGDTFNPQDTIKTNLMDDGTLEAATFDFKTGMLELSVLFDPNTGLINNEAPVAVNDTAVTFKNAAVNINVLANDTDSDGVLLASTVTIVSSPAHGTVAVNPDGSITYTPATNYVGSDTFAYLVKDDWYEPSNIAHVAITVNATADAINDSYIAFKDESLSVAASGVLGNDIGTGIHVSAYDASSVHGGTVTMASDGSFTYVPPSGYTGADSFTYTITDSTGHTDTATVNLTVEVRPMIYAKMITTTLSTASTNGGCNPAGYVVRSKVDIYFYADAGGTTPLDITGFGTTIHYRRSTHDNHTGSNSTTDFSIAGTSTTVQPQSDIVTHLSFYNCDGSYAGTDYTDTYSLLTGSGYTII